MNPSPEALLLSLLAGQQRARLAQLPPDEPQHRAAERAAAASWQPAHAATQPQGQGAAHAWELQVRCDGLFALGLDVDTLQVGLKEPLGSGVDLHSFPDRAALRDAIMLPPWQLKLLVLPPLQAQLAAGWAALQKYRGHAATPAPARQQEGEEEEQRPPLP